MIKKGRDKQMKEQTQELKNLTEEFAGFIGTDEYYKHPFFKELTYTEGVKAMASEYGAYWLIFLIFSHQYKKEVKQEPFQIWEIKSQNKKAVVVMRTDTGNPEIVLQKIPFTDFPEGVLKLYFSDGVLMLPSEY